MALKGTLWSCFNLFFFHKFVNLLINGNQERFLVLTIIEKFQPAGKAFVPALHKCRLRWLLSMPAFTDLCLLHQQNELSSELCILFTYKFSLALNCVTKEGN